MEDPPTVDHVLGMGWYPSHTPSSVKILTVPACQRCNREKSKVEEAAFHMLACCIEPDEPGYEVIVREHLRAFDPSRARGIRDRAYRQAKLRRFKNSLLGNPLINPRRILPMTRRLRLQPDAILVKADTKALERFYGYLIKGITYHLFDGRMIGDGATFNIDIRHEDQVMQSLRGGLIGMTAKRADWGPGLQVMYVEAQEQAAWAVMYKVIIWERHYFHSAARSGVPPRRSTPN